MTTRRARGDGGLHWDKTRERWVATATIGYDGRGKRQVRRAFGRTKTEAVTQLREFLQDQANGLTVVRDDHTVREAVEDWLEYGLGRQAPSTIAKYRILCSKHIIPLLGARKYASSAPVKSGHGSPSSPSRSAPRRSGVRTPASTEWFGEQRHATG